MNVVNNKSIRGILEGFLDVYAQMLFNNQEPWTYSKNNTMVIVLLRVLSDYGHFKNQFVQ